jgi:hypothetical protein
VGGGVREIEDGAKFVAGQGAGVAQLLERGDGLTDRPADAYASEQGTQVSLFLLLYLSRSVGCEPQYTGSTRPSRSRIAASTPADVSISRTSALPPS